MGESTSTKRAEAVVQPRRMPGYAIWSIGAIALAARLALFPYVSEDSTNFLLPWMQEFRDHGAAALGGEFSNYNFPYLFLMFLGSLLPLEPLFAIKLVSLLGDCLLAFSVGSVVKQFRPAGLMPATASVIALVLPTVLLNASMWGQCDSIYTAFLLLALRSLLKDSGYEAWLWWAVALSFKLQAVFFLPALVVISIRRRYRTALPAVAVGVWALLSIPPVFFGRSLGSTLSIYIKQTQDDRLVYGAANIYTWIPTVSAGQARLPALLICGAALLLTARAYWRGRDSSDRRVLLAITTVAICPLLLPQMHDRYFFAAEVMSLLLLRQKKLFIVPCLFAATGLAVYSLYFLSNQSALPLILASVFQCFAVGMLLRTLWQGDYQPPRGVSPG
jgi:Gpi18-like mannosyltransferase